MLLLTLVSFFVDTKNVHAQTEITDPIPTELTNAICESNQTFWEKVQTLVTLDIRRTVTNQLFGTIETALLVPIVGANHETIAQCIIPWNTIAGGTIAADGSECDPDPDITAYCVNIIAANCDPFMQDNCPSYCNVDEPGDCDGVNEMLEETRNSNWGRELAQGNLLSMANMIETTTNEPMPVNLAYYTNRQLSKVPFLGETYAQVPEDFGGPYLGVVYELWQLIRNAAYGMIAVVMIVIGVMIMTRKRINPQTMVTVQYAIPRVLIALVLITFSYVIGATIASTAWSLKGATSAFVQSLDTEGDVNDLTRLGLIPVLLLFLVILIGSLLSTGGGTLIVFLILAGAAVIMWLLIQFKILILYLKMMISIISAPISFAIGAIPGKESQTVNWFKGILAKALSIVLMKLVMKLTEYAVILLFIAQVNALSREWQDNAGFLSRAGDIGEFVGISILMLFITPFVFLFGFYQAYKLPKKIDEAFLGSPKRR